MSILIRDSLVLPLDEARTAAHQADILIENGSISYVGPAVSHGKVDRTIDGQNKLVMPGLINAHAHSFDTLLKGRYDNLPLEVWIPKVSPLIQPPPISPRLVYLRTMLTGIDALRSGTTCIHDDAADGSGLDVSLLEAMFMAYDDLGIRASCSLGAINRPLFAGLPFISEIPSPLAEETKDVRLPTTEEYLDLCGTAVSRFHDTSGRLRVVIAPSAPQWCTDDFLVRAAEFAHEHDLALHLHALESKVQAVASREGPRRSVIAHMLDLGLLDERITLAHAVWVSEMEIDILGEARCSVAHNPTSNLKLASGIAPIPQLVRAGVNLALGTDNPSAGDAARMFDVMRFAALLSKAWSFEPQAWLTAPDVLRAATLGGAQSLQIAHETGSIEQGKKADLLILDLGSLAFTPLNDIHNQLVYSENGSSIEYVIVDGKIILENGQIETVNEESLLAELDSLLPDYQSSQADTERANEKFLDFFEGIVRRANQVDLGFERRVSPGLEFQEYQFR